MFQRLFAPRSEKERKQERKEGRKKEKNEHLLVISEEEELP